MEDGSPQQALTVDALGNVATTIQENFSSLDAHINKCRDKSQSTGKILDGIKEDEVYH